jgi:DNA modification methylase
MAPYYDDGQVTIYHGDCRDVLPTIERVGLVLTDPPYALSAGQAEWRVTASVAIGLHEAAKRVIKGGAMLVFSTSSGRGVEYTLGAVNGKLPLNRILTWHKTDTHTRAAGPFNWDTVTILGFGRCTFDRPDRSSVFASVATYAKESGHRAELPEGIADWLYAPFAPHAVLDPFMGTGRLLEPAARAGHRAIGIEIEERYCEIAAKRLEQSVLALAAD